MLCPTFEIVECNLEKKPWAIADIHGHLFTFDAFNLNF